MTHRTPVITQFRLRSTSVSPTRRAVRRTCRCTRCHNLPPFEAIQTTDPGRALITGKWNDIGRFKGPILRALATRAPYFRNGSAQNLDAVVDFYNQRFDICLTHEAKADLIAFLLTLWMTGPNPRVQNGVQPDRGDPRPDESTATEPAACYGVSRSSAPWPR